MMTRKTETIVANPIQSSEVERNPFDTDVGYVSCDVEMLEQRCPGPCQLL